MAMRSRWRCASSRHMTPICSSPAMEYHAPGDRAALHQGVTLRRLRKRQHAADERLDRLASQEIERRMHVVEGRVAGAGDPDAPRDDKPRIDLDRPRADIAE